MPFSTTHTTELIRKAQRFGSLYSALSPLVLPAFPQQRYRVSPRDISPPLHLGHSCAFPDHDHLARSYGDRRLTGVTLPARRPSSVDHESVSGVLPPPFFHQRCKSRTVRVNFHESLFATGLKSFTESSFIVRFG